MAFVAAAYGVSAVALVILLAWIVLDGRTQRRAMRELEASGLRRRSDKAG